MYLELNNLRIESRHLNSIFWTQENELRFIGVALDWEGQGICNRLSQYRKGQIVEVVAEVRIFDIYEGICEIIDIEIPPREETDRGPVIYRFSGSLRPVITQAHLQYPKKDTPKYRYII